ncbi:hypothetical protein T484DRAFT_1768665 [Baffinella frigidus]|nr:hypothetical protein T484DRAFT_1768665 [Cryptophyta sp. CCMP2293]
MLDVDLRGASLIGADLSNCQLQIACPDSPGDELKGRYARFDGAMVHRTRLAGCDLSETSFPEIHKDASMVNLAGSSLREMTLEGISFLRAHMTRVDLSECHISSCIFTDADLRNSTLPRTVWNNVRFVRANVAQSNAEGATFTDCDFTDAKIDDMSNAEGATFTDCDFTDAHIDDMSNAEGATFTDCDFTEAKIDDMGNVEGSTFCDCDFTDACIDGVVRIDDIVFRGATLTRCNLPRASAKRCLFHQATLIECSFFAADLSFAKLFETKMQRGDMREVIITGASARDYQDADMLILITLEEPEVESSNRSKMDGVNAAHADWGAASLRMVSLSGARLEGAILDTCDLQDADVSGVRWCYQEIPLRSLPSVATWWGYRTQEEG